MASAAQPPLSQNQFQAAAHLLVRDLDLELQSGSTWSYDPKRNSITYDTAAIDRWPWARAMAALSHEAARARFTGVSGTECIERWLDRSTTRLLTRSGLAALVQTVDALRTDHLQMGRYPGVRNLMRWLYIEMVDASAYEEGSRTITTKFVLGLQHAWIKETWPDVPVPLRFEPIVNAAVREALPAVLTTVQHRDVSLMLEDLEKHLLPRYERLSLAGQTRAAVPARGPLAPDRHDPGKLVGTARRPGPKTGPHPQKAPDGPRTSARNQRPLPTDERGSDPEPEGPGTLSPDLTADAKSSEKLQHSVRSSTHRPARSLRRPRVASRRDPEPSKSIAPGVIQSPTPLHKPQIEYEAFDYPAAVRRLDPLIRSTLEGDGRRLGLAELMSRRRYGTFDPWRRPRTQRRSDRGEIDSEHPEHLLTDPSQAFVRGVRIPRADQQRDFANAILLDISGSMVQRGFPTRKFNRLVDSAVIFMEIHERLRIPYSVLSFSTTPVVHWRFDQSTWPGGRADGPSVRRPRDHSAIFRAMYSLEHRDTNDAPALKLAIRETRGNPGLKSVLVITDGISSDPAELRRLVEDLDRRNQAAPVTEQLKILAFGIGVLREEFAASYTQPSHTQARRSCLGVVVRDVAELPQLIGDAVAERLRTG